MMIAGWMMTAVAGARVPLQSGHMHAFRCYASNGDMQAPGFNYRSLSQHCHAKLIHNAEARCTLTAILVHCLMWKLHVSSN